jgi:hypothetical protein
MGDVAINHRDVNNQLTNYQVRVFYTPSRPVALICGQSIFDQITSFDVQITSFDVQITVFSVVLVMAFIVTLFW